MIVCSNCGTPIGDDLRFCPECGTPNPTTQAVKTTAVRQSASPKHKLRTIPNNQQPVVPPPDSEKNKEFQNTNATFLGAPLQGNPPVQAVAPAASRTPLIVALAVVSGLLLLVLGGVGYRFLLSDKKPAEVTAYPGQTSTPLNHPPSTPESITAQTQLQPQPASQPPSSPEYTASPRQDDATLRREVIETLNGWAAATRAHDLDAHMSYYADRLDTYYSRSKVGANYVRSSRTPAFTRYASLDVQLSNLSVAIDESQNVATTRFDKTYRFEGEKVLSGSVQQVIILTKYDGRWLITSERDVKVYYINK